MLDARHGPAVVGAQAALGGDIVTDYAAGIVQIAGVRVDLVGAEFEPVIVVVIHKMGGSHLRAQSQPICDKA